MTKPAFPTEVYGTHEFNPFGPESPECWYRVVFDSEKPFTATTKLVAVYKLDRIVNMRGEVVEEPAT